MNRVQLEGIALQVDVAVNGAQALEMERTTHYDLIFMDMHMPIMDGLMATRCTRESSLNESTPIMAMTANAFSEDREKCLEAGMTAFISKPVEPKVLIQNIFEILR